MEPLEESIRNTVGPDLSRYETFDPDYQKFTVLGRSVEWLEQFIEEDGIVLRTHVPKDRLKQILEQGLKVPDKNTDRTDSGPGEEKAIFATAFSGWKDREAIYFRLSLNKVFIRSTYAGRSGKRYMMNLRGFMTYGNRAPFDSRRAEFLIFEDIPPENFVQEESRK